MDDIIDGTPGCRYKGGYHRGGIYGQILRGDIIEESPSANTSLGTHKLTRSNNKKT